MIVAVAYIGLPYKDQGRGPDGFDCWGLVRLVYREAYGIELPSLVDGYKSAVTDADGVAALVRKERDKWAPAERPREGDVVILNIAGQPRHVGIWLTGGLMLHTLGGHDSAIEDLKGPKWARRVDGVYRYVG